MRLGIDFGTSNSAAAIVRDGQVQPIRFGDADQFRTSVYFPGIMQDPGEFKLEPGQEHELQALIEAAAAQARANGQARPLEALRREALLSLRRQWMEKRMAEPRSSSQLLQNAVYGDDALEAIERHDPDVAILDVRMPGRDGIEALQALRRKGDQRPVILLTARADRGAQGGGIVLELGRTGIDVAGEEGHARRLDGEPREFTGRARRRPASGRAKENGRDLRRARLLWNPRKA